MRKVATILVTTLLTAGALVFAAGSAQAERGKDGCFNYSYERGWSTTTVYYHNTCNSRKQIMIESQGYHRWSALIGAGEHGHHEMPTVEITSVWGEK